MVPFLPGARPSVFTPQLDGFGSQSTLAASRTPVKGSDGKAPRWRGPRSNRFALIAFTPATRQPAVVVTIDLTRPAEKCLPALPVQARASSSTAGSSPARVTMLLGGLESSHQHAD